MQFTHIKCTSQWIFLLFIYLYLAALGLHCFAQAFSTCSSSGLLFIVVLRLLTVMASLLTENRLSCGPGLSCSKACRIFQDQESKLCPLHWQADSYPLCTREVSQWILDKAPKIRASITTIIFETITSPQKEVLYPLTITPSTLPPKA